MSILKSDYKEWNAALEILNAAIHSILSDFRIDHIFRISMEGEI